MVLTTLCSRVSLEEAQRWLSAGDFHQLPPVAKGAAMLAVRRFAFEADCWSSCISACMILRKVFRQVSHTAAFADLTSRLTFACLCIGKPQGLGACIMESTSVCHTACAEVAGAHTWGCKHVLAMPACSATEEMTKWEPLGLVDPNSDDIRDVQADIDFVDTLAKIRTGSCSTGDLQSLEAACSRPLDLSDGILPTVVCLCPLPRQAPCSENSVHVGLTGLQEMQRQSALVPIDWETCRKGLVFR